MIKNIKDVFHTKEVYEVYSLCMYLPTFEKFLSRTTDYIEDINTKIYGYYDNSTLLGVIAFENYYNRKSEILGIAVKPEYRGKYIGKQLIEYIITNEDIYELFAETDNDAVDFYVKCGFEANIFYKNYDNKPVKRYKCTYYVQ